MIEIIDKSECCGCHACYSVCPKNAIKMIEDEKGFKIPKINKELCINCGKCDKVCPIKNTINVENKPVAYAAYNKDEDTRLNSSSGGIFSLLAEYILNLNGVVFGAKFNEKFEVVHDYITKKEDIQEFIPFGPFIVLATFMLMFIPLDFLIKMTFVIFTFGRYSL